MGFGNGAGGWKLGGEWVEFEATAKDSSGAEDNRTGEAVNCEDFVNDVLGELVCLGDGDCTRALSAMGDCKVFDLSIAIQVSKDNP